MAGQAASVVRQVKPILSVNRKDARRKVLTLYKAWIRQVPISLLSYNIPKSEVDCKRKIREEFRRHAHLTDLRIIDIVIVKGQMELQEVANLWKPAGALMHYWKETWEKKPTDFMSKFLSGQD
ncbi:PREDICTED: NADH dehydrogenase [ubiquinone] 1 alpha subcomplex subunit 6 isoform X1 [Acromyrmex echinatior]|uniref:NADH dehydrogenase [ubiquinone] 1 alpha subcomplex subunit 6 n=1 Tax=Acromyrmex echinatior TaxID=103372 RepID=F4WKQ3_ACREC|nr:PREDICTED: NADH dehydrogenase [ubiquinone] 1 alpha subcomplex subunit 6 isoform X1 [Acromyrmex echinatior]EGI65145.1 NADH dehydrogenase [ubiquinone] 1 alpha subcomplex subunit 6 [Acromyrmex echinatior]